MPGIRELCVHGSPETVSNSSKTQLEAVRLRPLGTIKFNNLANIRIRFVNSLII